MRLRDRVTIVNKGTEVEVGTYPAHFGYRRVDGAEDPYTGRPWKLSEFVEVITGPAVPFDPIAHEVMWRGKRYYSDGPAALMMRGNKAHHLTMSLQRHTG